MSPYVFEVEVADYEYDICGKIIILNFERF